MEIEEISILKPKLKALLANLFGEEHKFGLMVSEDENGHTLKIITTERGEK